MATRTKRTLKTLDPTIVESCMSFSRLVLKSSRGSVEGSKSQEGGEEGGSNGETNTYDSSRAMHRASRLAAMMVVQTRTDKSHVSWP